MLAHNNQINIKGSETGSLYTTKDKQNIFLKPNENNEWALEINHKQQSQNNEDRETALSRFFCAMNFHLG